MKLAAALRIGLGAVTLAALAFAAGAAGGVLETARELAAKNQWDEVVRTIEEHLRLNPSDRQIDDLLGQALAKVGRKDEAAQYLERALLAWPADDKELPKLRKRLVECDPLFARREALFRKVSKDLFQCAEDLQETGHVERALELLDRLRPVATGAEKAAITALADKIRSASETVDLDEKGGKERPENGWPELKVESQRYTLRASLEPAVAELLGRTMDEIYLFYLQIYFDGDEKKLDPRKATIVVHRSHEAMLGDWRGGPAPAGWWSPGEWEVHCYDTRTDTGTLDQMLWTLFHEASHHFMTMLERGGSTPAWLNEGTASFFEGASAMADGRVLWPDAAKLRLLGLERALKGDGQRIPTFVEVIGYDKPGSYPGEYYEFGWGIVYYLQQYEDPKTLEYVYRPLYKTYRNEIVQKGGNPRELFERVFVGANSPRGHTTLLEFERDWKQWILGVIYPLHNAPNRRELRLAEVRRYLDAAKLAAADKKAKVGEQELLLRAVGHLDFVRTKIDKPDEPDTSLLLEQADVLERAGRGSSAAPILEQLLDMAAEGTWAASEAQLEALGKRLARLDRKNAALRLATARSKNLAKVAMGMLTDYRNAQVPLLLRAYTFASLMAAALDDSKGLGEAARELRIAARDAGLLKGASFALSAPSGTWKTIYSNPETAFETSAERVVIESVRPTGRLCTAVPISGEYELRARFTREGEVKVGSQHGLIVSGTDAGDWLMVTIDHTGRLFLKRATIAKGGGVSDTAITFVELKTPPPVGQPFDIVAHVLPEGSVEVTVGDEGPYPFRLPFAPPSVGHVGVYVKSGRLVLERAVVEILP